ncbi:MAG: hypothetical protein AAF502_04245 [Bacteroidota bacterium]
MQKYLLLVLLLCPLSMLIAQPNAQGWKKRVSAANDMYQQGNYGSAAEYYWSAYKVKPTKYDLAYKAGECFALVRDYKNASKAYGAVREFHKELDKVNFYRGLSLKNEGKYQQAVAEFEYFISVYDKADKGDVYQEVLDEISGCQMGMEALRSTDSPYFFKHMGYSVNSSLTEFAPVIVGDNMIYFSSMVDGSAKVYRTQKEGDKWAKRSRVNMFNDIEQPHYGNGSFTPDGNRYYFTQCQITDAGKTVCQIYVTKKTGKNWGTPIKLPDFVNEVGSTNTHPNVYVEGSREVIYFTSDRSSGQGGMDIWYVIRNINSAEETYTMPVNLGTTVNTPKDEMTPFYDADKETLYFSSNGHINMGGIDIFKSKGNKTTWATPSNLGTPFNSSADDLYYVHQQDGQNGFLVSNRFIRPDKISTLDDDVFVFGLNNVAQQEDIEVSVAGTVVDYEQSESVAINNVKIELYEVDGNDKQTLVESLDAPDGKYEFIVGAGKHFRIEASKQGYLNAFFDLMTFEVNESTEIDQNIPLERIPSAELADTPEPQKETPAPAETTEAVEKPNPNVLPIDPATGQPLPGMEDAFGEPVHKDDLTTYEQYSLIMTSDENLAYLRKDDLWVPVVVGAVTETGIAENTESQPPAETVETAVPESQPEEIAEIPLPPPPAEEPTIVKEPAVEPQPVAIEKPELPLEEETTPAEPVEEKLPDPLPPPVEDIVEKTPLPPPVEEPAVEPEPVPPTEPEILVETVEEVVENAPTPVETETFNPLEAADEATSTTKTAATVEYRIQLVAVKEYKDHRYSRVKDLGPMEFEEVDTDAYGTLTRVMITGFPDLLTAKRALAKAKVRGFARAFAIRYESGVRVGVPLR